MPMSTPEHDIDCTKFPNTTNYSKPPTSLFPGPLIERHLSLPWPAGRGNGPGNVVERSVEGNLVRSFSVPYSLSFRFLFLTDPARLFAQLFPPVCAGFYKMHLDTCTSSSILVKPRMLKDAHSRSCRFFFCVKGVVCLILQNAAFAQGWLRLKRECFATLVGQFFIGPWIKLPNSAILTPVLVQSLDSHL